MGQIKHGFCVPATSFFWFFSGYDARVPRKFTLSAGDLAVARRLSRLRTESRLSREDWALRSGVGAEVISRVELGRMPLRYEDARKLLASWCHSRDVEMAPINPLWLAEGKEPMQLDWPLLLPAAEQIGLSYRTSFSAFATQNREVLAALTKEDPGDALPESWLFPYLLHWIKLEGLASKRARGLAWVECLFLFSARRLAATSEQAAMLLRDYEKACDEINAPGPLTKYSTKRNMSRVKPKMRDLLSRVRALTAGRGRKTLLARDLKVPLPRISEWLSGKNEPGGEITLRLLQWVLAEEAKQKSPGSATTPPRAKTRMEKHNGQKSKRRTSPPKK